MNLFDMLLRRSKRRGLPVPGNIEIIEILPVLSFTFKRSLSHLDAIQMALQHYTAEPKSQSRAKHCLLFQEVESQYPLQPLIQPAHILYFLRSRLANFISRVYIEIEQSRKSILQGNELMASLLVRINRCFIILREGIASDNAGALSFDEILGQEEQWTDAQLEAAITITYANVEKLDTFLSMVVSRYRKPRKIFRKWIFCTFGVGISMLSVWLLCRNDISALKAMRHFFSGRVEQRVISLKSEYFKTSREKDNEPFELNKASDELQSMLVNYRSINKSSENTPDEEMYGLVKSRLKNYNLISGLMAGGMVVQELLIFVQTLYVDLEMYKRSLKCFLRDNKIYPEFLATLPTVVFSIAVINLSRACLKKASVAKDKGKSKPRLLVAEVEKRIIDFLKHANHADGQRLNERSAFLHGLTLCSLDVLYKEIEKEAYITGEWESLKQDLLELGKSNHSVDTEALKRLKCFYKCLICLKNEDSRQLSVKDDVWYKNDRILDGPNM